MLGDRRWEGENGFEHGRKTLIHFYMVADCCEGFKTQDTDMLDMSCDCHEIRQILRWSRCVENWKLTWFCFSAEIKKIWRTCTRTAKRTCYRFQSLDNIACRLRAGWKVMQSWQKLAVVLSCGHCIAFPIVRYLFVRDLSPFFSRRV